MIKKYISIFLLSIMSFGYCFSQDNALKLNTFNFEALGVGLRYSVNYERLFSINKSSYWSLAMGYEFNMTDFIIPAITFIKGTRNCFEAGFALAYGINDKKFNCLRIGYRYQKEHILFRLSFTPILNYSLMGNEGILPWAGITIGVCL
jgi:hypothetical protein